MKSDLGRCVRLVVAGALVSALAGCGDDAPRPPVVIVTPKPPERTDWATTAFSGFQTDIWVSIELLLPVKGALDITVDWTFPTTWMYVYFGATNCQYSQLADRTCPFLVASETQNPKPRVLYTEALEPGTYYLVLYNVPRDPGTGNGSDNTEAVAIQVGLTPSASGQRSSTAVSLSRPRVASPPGL